MEMTMPQTKMEKAVDTIEAHFAEAHSTLLFVERALETELAGTYAKNVNPYNLIARVKKIEKELNSLSEECQKLSAEKQDLIDTAQSNLVQNRTSLRRLQARAGLPVPNDADDSVYESLVEILKEWNSQLGLKSEDAASDTNLRIAPHDLNVSLVKSKFRAHDPWETGML